VALEAGLIGPPMASGDGFQKRENRNPQGISNDLQNGAAWIRFSMLDPGDITAINSAHRSKCSLGPAFLLS